MTGTTSLKALLALDSKPTVFAVTSWTDCLVMLQQGQVDAISTDDAVLAGLAAQDPNVEVVGDSIAVEPYGIGIKKENEDLVRFVNGVLDEMRADGTWNGLYDTDLRKPRTVARSADTALPGLTMTEVSTEAIDRELASRTKEVAAMSATLIELESHPGPGARAPLSADGAHRTTVGGDREVARGPVGGPRSHDVDPGLRADGAGTPIPCSPTTTAPS